MRFCFIPWGMGCILVVCTLVEPCDGCPNQAISLPQSQLDRQRRGPPSLLSLSGTADSLDQKFADLLIWSTETRRLKQFVKEPLGSTSVMVGWHGCLTFALHVSMPHSIRFAWVGSCLVRAHIYRSLEKFPHITAEQLHSCGACQSNDQDKDVSM